MDREVAIELLKQEKGVLVQVINTGYMIGIGKEYTDKGRATIEALDLAIEALGQTESEDCISRQQVIEAIEGVDWYHVNSQGELVSGSTSDEESWYKAEDIYKAFESLPPVTPTERTREWIPVSEKNPSQTGEYLVTAVCDNGSTFTDKFGYTPTTDGGWYDPEVPSQTHTDWNEHIIAWQPMPTPYKGGDTE